MALSWVLRDPVVCSVIVGASKTQQIEANLKQLDSPAFTEEEISMIEDILKVES